MLGAKAQSICPHKACKQPLCQILFLDHLGTWGVVVKRRDFK